MKNSEFVPIQQVKSGSMQSFLLGIVVGVLITLLFTTKKGRQIMRALTEEGLGKFSEIEELLHAIETDENFASSMDGEDIADEQHQSEKPDSQIKEVRVQRNHPLRHITNGRKFFRKPMRK